VGWVPLSPREAYVPTYNVTNIYVTNINNPHQRWHEPRRPDERVRTGPIMYTNQGVPGGVTVVPQNVLRERQPISKAVIAPVDPRTIARWQAQPAPAANDARGPRNAAPNVQTYVPPPPARTTAPPRVIATPGGAVPAIPPAPGAARDGGTPWGLTGQQPAVIATPAPAAPAAPRPDGPPRGSNAPAEPRERALPVRPPQPVQPAQPARPQQPPQAVQPAQGAQGAQPARQVQPAAPAQPAVPAAQPVQPRGAPVAGQREERAPRPNVEERDRQAPAPDPRREQQRDPPQRELQQTNR